MNGPIYFICFLSDMQAFLAKGLHKFQDNYWLTGYTLEQPWKAWIAQPTFNAGVDCGEN
jgi:hypothetical protein